MDSRFEDEIAAFENVPVWVHGHTHIARTYRIGNTAVRSNALGFAAKVGAAPPDLRSRPTSTSSDLLAPS